jgi:hypothetical protein
MSNLLALRNGTDPCDFNIHSRDAVPNGTEAAALCGLAANTMNTYRSLNRGPAFFRVGSRIYYSRPDLQAWRAKSPAIKRGRKLKQQIAA